MVWPRQEGPAEQAQSSSGAPASRALPDFAAVEVSSGEAEGLTLSGRVLDPGGKPLAGAEVSLASSAQKTLSSVRCDACGQPLLSCQAHESAAHVLAFFEQQRGFLAARLTARTDAQGTFRFEHLSGVSFSVWAKAPGYGVAMRERAAPGESVDLFLPALRSIAGQVVDDAGQPVPGAHVHAVSRRTALPQEAVAGGDGSFTLEGLGEGPFYVLARAEGFLPAVDNQVEAGPQPLRLRLTRPRTLEVRVVRHGAPVAATVRLKADHLARALEAKGAPVRFTGLYPDQLVVTAEAQGLASVPRTVDLDSLVTQVTLELEEAGKLLVTVVDDAGQPVPQPELTLRTARGELIRQEKAQTGALVDFGPLAAGDYVVEGRAEGFAEAQLPARVKAGETPVELELARAVIITGQVMDEYGRPAPGVSVLVQPTGATTLADADGHFSAQVPTPGLYELHAHHSEWGGGKVKVTAPASGVQLSLEPRAALEVTVSSGGRRVEGADAILWVAREGIYRSDRPSGPDGVVPMRGLPSGTYQLVVQHPDYLPSEPRKVVVEEGSTQKVDVELPPGASLSGDVVDTQGVPVEGATLVLVPRSSGPAVSDARGHFEFRALRPERTYRVEARHSSYDQEGKAEGHADGPPVRVVLKKRDVFRGRVVGDDGAPVKRFRVDEHDVASSDGSFELALPSAGERIVFSVEASGYEPLMVDKPVAPDLGVLELKRAPSFSGRVRDDGGAPVLDAVVTCDVCDESVMTDAEGRFTMSSPPFVTQFTVSARKGRLSASQSVMRSDATRGPVELTLHPATRLHGTVYQANGAPAAGYPLEGVQADRGEPFTVVTGPDGTYSVDVSPGAYRFALGEMQSFAGEPMLVAQVGGADMRMDLGPSPGSGTLTVQVKPERGSALWVVAGDVPSANPMSQELMRSRYAQLIYQPASETVTLRGLPPGRYTLVWSSFHADTPGGPLMRTVDVSGSTQVALVR